MKHPRLEKYAMCIRGPAFVRLIKPVLLLFFTAVTLSADCQLTYRYLHVQFDSPWVYKDLKLIPVRFKEFSAGSQAGLEEGVIGFKDALREGKLSVKETKISDADITLLRVKNHSKKSILVHSGEIVAGGKQDRIFASTTIIPPEKKETILPVFCVEKGRWDRRPSKFRYGGTADAGLRKQMDLTQKQYKIWREIDRQLIEDNNKNPTWAYIELFKDSANLETDSSYLQFYRRKMKETDSSYAGFIGITGNRIINCELFGNSDLCLASFESMVISYARSINENDGVPVVADKNVKEFLDLFLQNQDQQKRYLKRNGKMYLYEKMVIHLVAYPDETN